jgi:hypothetical protein
MLGIESRSLGTVDKHTTEIHCWPYQNILNKKPQILSTTATYYYLYSTFSLKLLQVNLFFKKSLY